MCCWSQAEVLGFLVSLLVFLSSSSAQNQKYLYGRNGNTDLSRNIVVRMEISSFMQYAVNKMGALKCLTFVWDNSVDGTLVESLHDCHVSDPVCSSYKYQIHYEEQSNDTTMMEASLRAGYRRQCGGYIIAMERKEKILHFLNYGDNYDLINTRAKFLIWYKGNDRAYELSRIWTKITNVIFFYFNKKRRSTGVIFTIRELIWPVNINSKRNRVRVIEFWSQNEKHFIYKGTHEWFHDNSNDLRNVTLKILVMEHPPGVIKLTDADGKARFGGTEVEIIQVLSSTLNFNYELQEIDLQQSNADIITNYPKLWANIWKTSDSDAGSSRNESQSQQQPERAAEGSSRKLSPNDTQSYFAAASKLITGDGADIAIGSFYIFREYLDYLDMSIPLDVACTSFLTPIPVAKPKYLALILPFQYKLWICVIVICLIVGPIVLRVLALANKRYKDEFGMFRAPTQVIFTSFSIMAQVPQYIWPKFWPFRWFIGWYWLFWVIVTLAYRASMVAFLTIPLIENPIENLHDLQESQLNIGGWGIELYQLFTKSYSVNETNIDRKNLALKYEIVKDMEDAISRVAGRKFALYENVRFLQFIKMTRNLSSSGAPTMRLMKQCVAPVHVAFAYQKHSALTYTINRKIQKFLESGLLIKWRRELISKKKEFNLGNQEELFKSDDDAEEDSENQDSSEQKVLTMHDLQGCFYTLLLGTLISIAAFIGEFILYHVLKSQAAGAKIVLVRVRKSSVNLNLNIQDQVKDKVGQLKFMLLMQNEIYKEFTEMGERKVVRRRRKRGCPLRKEQAAPFPYVE